MKKNKLGIAFLVGALLAVSLVACNNETLNQGNNNNNENNNIIGDNNQNNETENGNNDVEPIESGEIYYFYDETFMGSLENGEWNSPTSFEDENLKTKEWKCSDILSQEKYKMYNEFGQSEDMTTLTVFLEYGVGDFFGELRRSEEYYKREDYRNALKKSANYESGYYTLNLPVKIDEKYEEITSDFTTSTFSFSKGMKKSVLMTNMKKELNFAKKATDIELSNKALEYIAKYKEEKNIAEDLAYACWYKFEVDVNNNGQTDEVYVVSSVRPENWDEDFLQLNEKGQFSMAFAIIDGKATLIYDTYISKDEIEPNTALEDFFNKIAVIDLDQDGEYEICLTEVGWECIIEFVFDYIDGGYKLVLFNQIG